MESYKQLVIQGVFGLILVFALTYGQTTVLPDNVRTLYGFPLTWGIHQINSISGPDNKWIVNTDSLLVDLTIWVIILIIVPLIADRFTIETCRKCIGKIYYA